MAFTVGQRWISDSESELGLGTVVSIEGRRLTLFFASTGEDRYYAANDAPITRVAFNVGDTVTSIEEWQLVIEEVIEQDELLVYKGTRSDTNGPAELREIQLSPFLKFNKPQDRLYAGQIDRFDHYVMRYQTLQQQYQRQASSLKGLLGPRVSLIPHQLYIAHEVGRRLAPRVLLSDEVGLGKTIEAGLIIHHQILAGLAKRVLIVVPEALQYQWLVEMLRRFNLHFSVFDEDRWLESRADAQNAFESEQLVLCSLDFISGDSQRFNELSEAGWDLLVVDEAHHLEWSADKVSQQYQLVETLAEQTPGVLLLTATPDQLGHEGHFARLRLLDAQRFHSYQDFVEEEQNYQPVANVAQALADQQTLTAEQANLLTELLGESDIQPALRVVSDNASSYEQAQEARVELLQHLLDRHGTGRIMFRNTRHAIQGFPVRELNSYPLALPEQYQTALKVHQAMNAASDQLELLTPESLYQAFGSSDEAAAWCLFDPRVEWLLGFLQANKQHKVLLICAKASTALELETVLRIKEGIRSSVFHEGMSIIERDKAAAYFAQEEAGAQLMICSEIGSEGRNFQFAHHLVLFDLPINPDLLEQRIGRLDRIGQQHDIQLHVPYLKDTPQQTLLQWYHQSLNSFEQTSAAASIVYQNHREELHSLLQQSQVDEAALNALLSSAKQQHTELKQKLESGRDRLLEIHSSGGETARDIVEQIQANDSDHHFVSYCLKLLDTIGVNQDDKGENALVLHASEQMLVPSLDGLPEDGTTITFDRDTALSREDLQFVTWEHPLVASCVDAILSSERGTASVALLKNRALEVGTVFLEALFVAEASGPSQYQLERYLPATPIRVLLDKSGNLLSDKLTFEQFNVQLSPVNRHLAAKLVGVSQPVVHGLLGTAQQQADTQLVSIIEQAQASQQKALGDELERLEALSAINPSIRQDELDALREQLEQGQDYLGKAQVKLDALRVIIVSHN